MTYRACIFDLDGVITDTAHYHFLAWKALADGLGIPFDEDDNHHLKGVGRMESLDFILARSDRTFDATTRDRLATEKNDHYKTLIKGISPADLLPGIIEAFDWLDARGIRIGLASASKNAPEVIAGLGIADRFHYVADAGAIPRGKPAPDIFLDVANAFGIAPEDAIGVEDAAAGVTAIKAAGMRAVGIGDAAILREADLVLPDTSRLAANGLAVLAAQA
ncbi:beta-phosphoglucomutase [Pseudokordiimonas caeni]|uniref:beta-phosphoglucomutase n=1 Tax=Pseudokordiimonas caeni TaxID=2997908 RepID=UPI00281215A7|nr:beta-phosphoglucomutase [Pseudokordiimonas caeni]